MSDRLRESVSALVDGEADELELRRLLASAHQEEVRTAWRDFHLHRDSVAGVDMRFARFDISGRVQAALLEEKMPAIGTRWWRPLTSVAVAASVAAVVAVGIRGVNTAPGSALPGMGGAEVAQMPASPASGRVYPAQPGTALGNVAVSAQLSDLPASLQPVSVNPDELAQQRLQRYLLRHTERAALTNGQGLINFVRVSQLEPE